MILRIVVLLSALAGGLFAQGNAAWTEPFPAHKVAGNIYYVGSKGLASYLITTSQGHILINSSLEASVPLIRASIEKLGFKFSDVKILLINHAHWDHCAGSATIKELTGAKYMVMDADVPEIEAGGKGNFQYGNRRAPGTSRSRWIACCTMATRSSWATRSWWRTSHRGIRRAVLPGP